MEKKKMIVATYDDALEVIRLKLNHNDFEFADVEVKENKPVMNINHPIDSWAERAILRKQERIHFTNSDEQIQPYSAD